jgi:hypothetical protein
MITNDTRINGRQLEHRPEIVSAATPGGAVEIASPVDDQAAA